MGQLTKKGRVVKKRKPQEPRLGDQSGRFTRNENLEALRRSLASRRAVVSADIMRVGVALEEAPAGRARNNVQLRLDELRAESRFLDYQLSMIEDDPWNITKEVDRVDFGRPKRLRCLH